MAPFQWLNVSESQVGGPLGVIFSVAFFRGLDPAEVMRRFSLGEHSGEEAVTRHDYAAWDANHRTAVPRGFALAAEVTGVPLTPDMLDRPMLVGPIVLPE
ncbi:hypothetical protein [Nonomuraea jiangxiensis]|uniref:Uncharacterized protein n=1 Tax=Nonomuraea jiangxiensis TaxID=633440 RepID=A0A1G9TMX1_9ACTN|nr:hypothetical protein [Nonomuraea jiangxiensis]SDM49097.1 hypothetical protein SAMN05421869_14540 [Nonomuraea jiangxiensis]